MKQKRKMDIAPGGCVRNAEDLLTKRKSLCVFCQKNLVEYEGDPCVDCGEKADAEEDGFFI